MAEPPLTRVTLLTRLKDGADTQAWGEFVRLYGPVVYGFARKRGLQDADAADLMQEVMRSVARHAERLVYDPTRGTFRGWLYTITRNKIYNFLSAQKNRPKSLGGANDSGVQERFDSLPAREDEAEPEWDLEYLRGLSAQAMELVRHEFQANTWAAFQRTAVAGEAPQEVASALKMSAGAVYVAKSRVLARLRDEVRRLQAEADAW